MDKKHLEDDDILKCKSNVTILPNNGHVITTWQRVCLSAGQIGSVLQSENLSLKGLIIHSTPCRGPFLGHLNLYISNVSTKACVIQAGDSLGELVINTPAKGCILNNDDIVLDTELEAAMAACSGSGYISL